MTKRYFFIIFIFIEITIFSIFYINYNSKKQTILNSTNKLVKSQFKTINDSFQTLANTVFKGYINSKEILNSFEVKNRNRLFKLLHSDYKYLRLIDFEQVHFHLPNNKSFLRMHKPNRYGDDLSNIRYSVKYVNKNKKAISGLEMGRVLPGFRFVYPLYNNNNYIGSVETSFSIKAFIKKLEKVYNVHVHFLLNKNIYNDKVFQKYKQYYSSSIESNDFILLKRAIYHKGEKKEKYIKEFYQKNLKNFLKDNINKKGTFSFEIKLNSSAFKNSHKIVTFLNLKNIQNRNIGYFVIYQDNKELKEIEEEFYENILLFSIIHILLFFYIYKELSTKLILEKKVKEKTKELKILNNSLEKKIKEEVKKSKKAQEQLYEYEKLAQMGELIGNIAHQWRQPLSAISVAASGLKLADELKILNSNDIKEHTNSIIKNTKQLSNTIDTFRDFTTQNSKIKYCLIQDCIKDSLHMIKPSLETNHIKLETSLSESRAIYKYLVPNDISQIVINIVNNSKDALIKNSIENPHIKISLEIYKDYFKILFQDNAKGIKKDIINKIFEPYFTTKHQGQGVGLGLHICRKIVTNKLNGTIEVQSCNMGTKFIVKIPFK